MSQQLYKATTELTSVHFGSVGPQSEPFHVRWDVARQLVAKGWLEPYPKVVERKAPLIPKEDLEVLLPSLEQEVDESKLPTPEDEQQKEQEYLFKTIREKPLEKDIKPEIRTKEEKQTKKRKRK